jgi:ankyrin repeat protein
MTRVRDNTETKLTVRNKSMNTPFIGCILLTAFITFSAGWSSPALGQDTDDMLGKALDLVHQVENPAGNPPTDAQRIDLLTQAITLAQEAPNHRLKGHRVLAIQAIRGAITEIQGGDANHQAAVYLHTADAELTTSISLAKADETGTAAPSSPSPPPTTNQTTPQSITSTNGASASTDTSWMAHPTINITQAQADIFNAARGGDLAKLKSLLAGDPTLAQSHVSCDMTPLLGAAAGNHADTAAALLDLKADVNAKNWINQTPLHYAAIGGFKDMADLLIARGADVNARDKDGHTPLYEAMNQIPWHKDVAELLLAHGADPNIGDNEGKTPLHEAAGWIRTDKLEFLLGYKVDVNARDKNGETPLYAAISSGGRDDFAQILLAHGADASIKGPDGRMPREVALQKGDTDMAGILANPTAMLGPPPAPADGIAPPDLIAKLMTDIAKKPPGPVENDVTEDVVQTMEGMAQLTKMKISPRESIATGFGIFTLDSPVTEFYAQGLAAIYEGNATLTESAAKDFQDDHDQSSATMTNNGKTVTDKGPFLMFGPGAVDFTDAKVPADRRVIVSFCLVQQHGRWKVHCLYFSTAPLADRSKDFIVRQLAEFSRKQGG